MCSVKFSEIKVLISDNSSEKSGHLFFFKRGWLKKERTNLILRVNKAKNI